MAGITLEIAQTNFDLALEAFRRASIAQEVSLDGDRNRQNEIDACIKAVQFWDRLVKELTPRASGGGIRVLEVIPR